MEGDDIAQHTLFGAAAGAAAVAILFGVFWFLGLFADFGYIPTIDL